MPKIIEGKLLAEGKRFVIIVSRFNDFITEKLVGGALDALQRSGADTDAIRIVKVPGAFEIPAVIHKSGIGVPTIMFGVPVRYAHAHHGVFHLSDYRETVKLLVALIARLDSATMEYIRQHPYG